MNNLLKLAEEFESRLKRVRDVGDELAITQPLVEDLLESIQRTSSTLNKSIQRIRDDKDHKFSEEMIKQIRDCSGNLALLCNMILNGKHYSKEEMSKAISDDVD